MVAGCSEGPDEDPPETASARGTAVRGRIVAAGEDSAGSRADPAPPTRSLSILVLMPSGEPATTVPVRFVDTLLIPRASLLAATGGEPDAEKLLEVLGQERMTDGEGRVSFQTSGGPLLASAELGELYAMQPFAPPGEDADELILKLGLDTSVRARAVGPEGQPLVGIPVALSMELPPRAGEADEAARWIDLAVRETSGEDATVRFRDAHGGVQRSSRKGVGFSLRLAIPGLVDQTPVPFDPERPPQEPLELAVPALSTLLVEVLSATGQLVEIEANVYLAAHDSAPGRARLRTRLQGGRASFDAVPPGTLLRVTVEPTDGGSAFTGVGPSALVAGDVASIAVSMPGQR